ncbi:MAG: LysM peptidoglycan-binding domain-containing protein [Planctomycetes bacterium]|nr:LysM peptidoglycan-binding domain-containing protein [Planctomycetota bacterium]
MMPRRVHFSFLALCLLWGCNEESKTEPPVKETTTTAPVRQVVAPPPPTTPTDEFVDSANMPGRIHVVQPGETLLLLSERFYNDRGQWRRIWLANKRRLRDPNDLPVGMKLIIP